MGMKLFDDGDDALNDDVSRIEINKEFARRYEHNKKREDLQRYEEMKRKGQIEVSFSGSESESESSEDESGTYSTNPSKKEEKEFIENLIKVKNRDPVLYQKVELFKSESDSDIDAKEDIEVGDGSSENADVDKKKKKKAMYLKDVVARQLIEEGPEFDKTERSKKNKEKDITYNKEQEELKKAFLDAVNDADGEGDFLKVKEKGKQNEESEDDAEYEKKLEEYFGREGELDENQMFLKRYFLKHMWIDMGSKDKKSGGGAEADDMDELLMDEEDVEKQEEYEEKYNFRYQEDAGDRVVGHSRIVEGSVRNKDGARKLQRKSKEERMRIAEMERKEELKHLKNLKKKEMKERMRKVMEAAGIKDDVDCLLDLDDLEEEFDPEEYDKMMKKAFNEKYYEAEDVNPDFGSDYGEDGGDFGKPDFDKEDELLGLPKGWDAADSGDGFYATRERILKLEAENGNDDSNGEEEEEEVEEEEEEEGKEEEKQANGEGRNEESKRKRKQKMSLVKKIKEEMLEEYYKLDYEDAIGDLKTRFKYAKVNPNRYGLKTEEILWFNDQDLNQYVSIKKLAPYREKEWKVPNSKRYQHKMRVKEYEQGKSNGQKANKQKRSKDYGDKSTPVLGSNPNSKAEVGGSNADMGNLSRKAKRRKRNAEFKLPQSRRAAYGQV